MSTKINSGAKFALNYLLFSNFLIPLIQGKRRECLDDPPSDKDIFAPEHYGEVGYARDVCVELGRNLIRTLQLQDATKLCNDLENEKVLARAIKMVEDFNEHVSEYSALSTIAVQKSIWESIDITLNRLINSKAAEARPDLIDKIYQLRSNYCKTYISQQKEKEDTQQVDEGTELQNGYKKEGRTENAEVQEDEENPPDKNESVSHKIDMKGSTIDQLNNVNHKIDMKGPTIAQLNKEDKEKKGVGRRGTPQTLFQGDDEEKRAKNAKAKENEENSQEHQEYPEQNIGGKNDLEGRVFDESTKADAGTDPAFKTSLEYNERREMEEWLDRIEAENDDKYRCIDYAMYETGKTNARPSPAEYKQTVSSRDIEIDIPPSKDEDGRDIFTSVYEKEEAPLHESVFRGDMRKFTILLNNGYDVAKKDKHGNTALHLAAMLGRKDYIDVLLKYNAPVRSRNSSGWSAIDEAVSYGDEDIIMEMLPVYNKQIFNDLMEKRRALLSELETIDDFYMEMRWDFHCWIPGVTYLLPSDLCKIRKRGSSIRMDSTLAGFDYMKIRYKRGDVSFLFDSTTSPNPTLFFMNNEEKYYSTTDFELGDTSSTNWTAADAMLHQDIQSVTISRSSISFKKCWDWMRFDKTIGRFKAHYYEVSGMVVKFRKRREHLSKQQMKQNKAEVASVKRIIWDVVKGNLSAAKEDSDDSDESESKQLRLPVDKFARIIEVLAPFKHFNKLREFIQMKLPEGFPVKLEIPLVPTISARITFPEFLYCSESKMEPFYDNLFHVPEDYTKVSGSLFF